MNSAIIYVQGAPVITITTGVNRQVRLFISTTRQLILTLQGNFWCSYVDGSGNISYHYQNQ